MRSNGERRQVLRYSLDLPVEVAGACGRTRDFSASGVFFETDRALTPGAPVRPAPVRPAAPRPDGRLSGGGQTRFGRAQVPL